MGLNELRNEIVNRIVEKSNNRNDNMFVGGMQIKDTLSGFDIDKIYSPLKINKEENTNIKSKKLLTYFSSLSISMSIVIDIICEEVIKNSGISKDPTNSKRIKDKLIDQIKSNINDIN